MFINIVSDVQTAIGSLINESFIMGENRYLVIGSIRERHGLTPIPIEHSNTLVGIAKASRARVIGIQ